MRYSIIIPCLDRPKELELAIRSCLEQSFEDYEIIVVDDGSNPPLMESIEIQDKRIRFIVHPVRLGASSARNTGLAEARGDYISFLDSDDTYLPERLERIESALKTCHSPIVIHKQTRQFTLSQKNSGVIPERLPQGSERLDEFMMINGNWIQTNSYVIDRNVATRFSFNTECPAWEDNIYLLECWLYCNKYVVVDEILSCYNDQRRAGRLSKQRNPSRHDIFVAFARSRCSEKAYEGIKLLQYSEVPIWRNPFRTLFLIYRGTRIGVSIQRSIVYLSRSIIGFQRTENILYGLRGRG